MGTTSPAALIRILLIFPGADAPECEDIWADAMAWAVNSLNRAATTMTLGGTIPYEMCRWSELTLKDLPILTPCFDTRARVRKRHIPPGVPGFYLEPDYRHHRDFMRVLGPSWNIIMARHHTWWAPPIPRTGHWCSHGGPHISWEDGPDYTFMDVSSERSAGHESTSRELIEGIMCLISRRRSL